MTTYTSLRRGLTGLGLTLGAVALSAQAALAVKFPDGRVAFNRPPSITNVEASFDSARVSNPTYTFKLTVPAEAGEPLQALEIVQRDNAEAVQFKPQKSRAFVNGSAIAVTASGTETPGTIRLVFDTPIQPGETVTVDVNPKRNPTYGGVYLFGVTAYPEGEAGIGQFIGHGRIHIYRRG